MRKEVSLVLLVMTVCFVFASGWTYAAQEADHPFFQSNEFKAFEQEKLTRATELVNLQEELRTLKASRASYGPAIAFYSLIDTVPSWLGYWPFAIMSCVSILLICTYYVYLKRFNSLKWHILFSTKGNLKLLLNSIRRFNSLGISLICLFIFASNSEAASTSWLKDMQFFLFGNDIQKSYVLLKHPMEVISLPYTDLNSIYVYQRCQRGTFENYYDLLVHKHMLPMPLDASEVHNVITKSSSLEGLHHIYAFLFMTDEQLIRAVVSETLKRLEDPRISIDKKLVETGILLDQASKSGKLGLVKGALGAFLNKHASEANTIGYQIVLAYQLTYVDKQQAEQLFVEKLRFKFGDMLSEQHKPVFRGLVSELLKERTPSALYPPEELEPQISSLRNEDKLRLAIYFDDFCGEVAAALIRPVPLSSISFASLSTVQDLVHLVRKHRPEDSQLLYGRLIYNFVRSSGNSVSLLASLAGELGVARKQLLEELVAQDQEVWKEQPLKSTLVDRQFVTFLNPEELEAYREFIKSRRADHKGVLEVLLDKNYGFFLDYLNALNNDSPEQVLKLNLPNRLVGLARWKDFLPEDVLKSATTIPATHYLLDAEISKAAPDSTKVALLARERMEPIFLATVHNDKKLNDNELSQAIILHALFTKNSAGGLKEYADVLTEIIQAQLPAKLQQQRVAWDQSITPIRQAIASLNAELSQLRGARFKAISLFILMLLFGLYMICVLVLSIKYAANLTLSYSSNRIALFTLVLLETWCKFLLPIFFLTGQALVVIIVIQLYGFLSSKDRSYPNGRQSLEYYKKIVTERG